MGLVSNLFASIEQFSSGFADVVVMRVCGHTNACACESFRCGDDVRLVTRVNFTTFILQSSFHNVDECKGRGCSACASFRVSIPRAFRFPDFFLFCIFFCILSENSKLSLVAAR